MGCDDFIQAWHAIYRVHDNNSHNTQTKTAITIHMCIGYVYRRPSASTKHTQHIVNASTVHAQRTYIFEYANSIKGSPLAVLVVETGGLMTCIRNERALP